MQRKFIPLTLIALLAIVSGCNKQSDAVAAIGDRHAVPSTNASNFKPLATVQEIMQSIVDPNVDPIWNSISTVVSAEGAVEKRPETDEEWDTLRKHAISLREVPNLLVIEGRDVAHSHANTSTHESELQAEAIQALIIAQWPQFTQRANALRDAANLAVEAIDAKNVDRLEEVGGIIEHACEGCHSQFWYPGDKAPAR